MWDMADVLVSARIGSFLAPKVVLKEFKIVTDLIGVC